MSVSPDVCKGGKPGHKCPKCGTRHQSVRQYVNRNKPSVSPPVDWIPDADDGVPSAADAVKAAGNPVPPSPGSRPVTDRLSPSRVTGGAAPSTGDHNAAADPMNVAGPKRLALGHPDMRQGTTRPVPLLSVRSNADDFPRDLRGVPGVPIALDRLDAAGAAGMPPFRADPSGSPVRPLDHIARDSATSRNGTHSLSDPRSHAAPMAAKAMTGSEARETLKRHMFPGGGGGR